jgi:nucleotide-binding universal stress UspA family protein
MKSILVTTDLSPESKKAFPLAKTLAAKFGASITLLAVVEDPSQAAFAYAMEFPVYPDPAIHQQVITKVQADLETIKAQDFPQTTCEAVVSQSVGNIAAEICEVAKTRAVDMVILSSHGRSGLSRLLIGSVAERVIREAACPVLVVPSRQ